MKKNEEEWFDSNKEALLGVIRMWLGFPMHDARKSRSLLENLEKISNRQVAVSDLRSLVERCQLIRECACKLENALIKPRKVGENRSGLFLISLSNADR